MGKNSKQRRQATVDELSWAREYMDLFVPCNNGYNVIISKKGKEAETEGTKIEQKTKTKAEPAA